MKIITKYILQQMLFGFVLITSGLLMIVWLSQSLRLFEILLNSKVSIGLFVRLTLTLVPSYLSIISPIALFAVTLFTYNRLIADRELIVLRAAGMSPMQLAKPAIAVGTIFTLVGFYISIVLVPAATSDFRSLRWKIQHDVSHLLLQEGEFNEVGKGITVYIRSKAADGALEGIILHDGHSPKSEVTLLAERGTIAYHEGVPQISMQNGSRQEIVAKSGRFSILYFDSYNMDFFSKAEKNAARSKKQTEASMRELFAPEKTLLDNRTYRRFRLEAFRRLSMPFYNLSFMLIAATGLLTGVFNRRGNNRRVIVTVLIMAAFQVGGLCAENIAGRDLRFIPLLFFFSTGPVFVCPYILKNAGMLHFDGLKKRAEALRKVTQWLRGKRKHSKK